MRIKITEVHAQDAYATDDVVGKTGIMREEYVHNDEPRINGYSSAYIDLDVPLIEEETGKEIDYICLWAFKYECIGAKS